MPPPAQTASFICHPATPAPVVRSIEAQVSATTEGLALAFCLRGDMARLLIPQTEAPDRTDFLWEHSCFEAFVAVDGQSAYREFNFSPSGQWAAYAFSAYRQPDDATCRPGVLPIVTRRFAGRLELDALIPATALPVNTEQAALRIALCAVVEAADTVDGSHSYWALHHAAARPDFHHRDTFVLELADPRQTAA